MVYRYVALAAIGIPIVVCIGLVVYATVCK